MWTLIFLCSVLITHSVQAWTTWGIETDVSTDPVSNCGGYLYGSSDNFNSPNYPNSYPNNLACVWYIRPGRQIIQLDFYVVNTECGYDDIYIYDGSSTGDRLLGRICNSNSSIFHSTGSYLTVRFRTDSSVTKEGFRASYRVVSRGLCRYNCGYQVGQCSCSPGCEYRGNCCTDYQTYCSSTTDTPVTAQPSCRYNCGYNLGSCSCASSCQYYGNCCHDYNDYCYQTTSEHAWPTTTGQPSCRYNCGYHMGSCSCASSCQYYGNCCHDYNDYCYQTTSEHAWPTTTGQPSCRYNCGYHMGSCSCASSCQYYGNCCHDYNDYCYQTTQDMTTTDSNCGGYLYGSSDNFNSPNYPNSYPNNLACVWYIRPGRQIIQLDFYVVNTECGFDDIYIYDGSSTGDRLLGRICNSNSSIFHSTGSYLTVRFRTDGSVTKEGFRASYRVVSRGLCRYNCGYQVGECSCSPGCEYRGNCCTDYQTYCGGNTTVPLSCQHNCGSHLGNCSCTSSCQYYGDCCHDYHSYCGATTASPTTGPSCRYNCGYHVGSCSCTSSCQYYGNCCHDYHYYCAATTTPSESCGGSLFGSGTFSSPNHPSYYYDNAYCVWQLRTTDDQRIFLAFTYLQLENCCSCDYITIHDGPSVTSRLLGKVCNDSTSVFYSSSKYMTVLFRTDGSVVGRGFKADFMSTLQPSSGRVDCSSDNMNIVIEKSYLNSLGYDGHSLYLNDPHCRPQVSMYQVVFSVPLNTCGNVRRTVGGRISYTNSISAYTSTQGEITRQSHLKMNITCLMEPDSTSQIAFIVDHGTNSSITGSGRYNTSMAFYTSSSFYEKVTEVPYTVSLNQYLYVQVGLKWSDSSLILFLDTCVASPTPFDFHTRAYYLVRDGCRVDDTYHPIATGTQSVARFSFRAFQFLRASEAVYIQCKVVICPASESNSRCRRGCSRRAARGLESEHESQTVVAGPIKLKDSEKKKEEPENQNKA